MYIRIHSVFNFQAPSAFVGVGCKCCIRVCEANETNTGDLSPWNRACTNTDAGSQIPNWTDQLLEVQLHGFRSPECRFEIVQVPLDKCGKYQEESGSLLAETSVDVIKWARNHKAQLKVLVKNHPDKRMILGSSFGPVELPLLNEKEAPVGSTLQVEWIILRSAMRPVREQVISIIETLRNASNKLDRIAPPPSKTVQLCANRKPLTISPSLANFGNKEGRAFPSSKLNDSNVQRTSNAEGNECFKKGISVSLIQKWEKWVKRNRKPRKYGAGMWNIKNRTLMMLMDEDIIGERGRQGRCVEKIIGSYNDLCRRIADKEDAFNRSIERRCRGAEERLETMRKKEQEFQVALLSKREKIASDAVALYKKMFEEEKRMRESRSRAAKEFEEQCFVAGQKFEESLQVKLRAENAEVDRRIGLNLVVVEQYLKKEKCKYDEDSQGKNLRAEIVDMRDKWNGILNKRWLETEAEHVKFDERKLHMITMYRRICEEATLKCHHDLELIQTRQKRALRVFDDWNTKKSIKMEAMEKVISSNVTKALDLNTRLNAMEVSMQKNQMEEMERVAVSNEAFAHRYLVAAEQEMQAKAAQNTDTAERSIDLYYKWARKRENDNLEKEVESKQLFTKISTRLMNAWRAWEEQNVQREAIAHEEKKLMSMFVANYRSNRRAEEAEKERKCQIRAENSRQLWYDIDRRKAQNHARKIEEEKKQSSHIRASVYTKIEETSHAEYDILSKKREKRNLRAESVMNRYHEMNVREANTASEAAMTAKVRSEAVLNFYEEIERAAKEKKAMEILQRKSWVEQYRKMEQNEKDLQRREALQYNAMTNDKIKHLLEKIYAKQKQEEKELDDRRTERSRNALTLYKKMYGV